jgi:K+-transporting ATPase c subunit
LRRFFVCYLRNLSRSLGASCDFPKVVDSNHAAGELVHKRQENICRLTKMNASAVHYELDVDSGCRDDFVIIQRESRVQHDHVSLIKARTSAQQEATRTVGHLTRQRQVTSRQKRVGCLLLV